MNVRTKYLTEFVENLDLLYEEKEITKAEYIMIGLQLKSFEALLKKYGNTSS